MKYRASRIIDPTQRPYYTQTAEKIDIEEEWMVETDYNERVVGEKLVDLQVAQAHEESEKKEEKKSEEPSIEIDAHESHASWSPVSDYLEPYI